MNGSIWGRCTNGAPVTIFAKGHPLRFDDPEKRQAVVYISDDCSTIVCFGDFDVEYIVKHCPKQNPIIAFYPREEQAKALIDLGFTKQANTNNYIKH